MPQLCRVVCTAAAAAAASTTAAADPGVGCGGGVSAAMADEPHHRWLLCAGAAAAKNRSTARAVRAQPVAAAAAFARAVRCRRPPPQQPRRRVARSAAGATAGSGTPAHVAAPLPRRATRGAASVCLPLLSIDPRRQETLLSRCACRLEAMPRPPPHAADVNACMHTADLSRSVQAKQLPPSLEPTPRPTGVWMPGRKPLRGERRSDRRRPEGLGSRPLDQAWTAARMGADVPPPAHGGGCGPLAATAAWLKWRSNGADSQQEAWRRGLPGRGRQLLSDVDAGPSITKHWQPGGLACGRIPRGSVVNLGAPLGA
eukprot:357360-Chlamydomonas_euryale.AAC.1